jgi:hypothetical protein
MTTINRFRGDTAPIRITVREGRTAKDITGHSFVMTVDDTRLPPVEGATPLFSMAGVLSDPTGGVVSFSPAAADVDRAGSFWFDVEMTAPDGKETTVGKGRFVLVHDITHLEQQLYTFEHGTEGTTLTPGDITDVMGYAYSFDWYTLSFQERDGRAVLRMADVPDSSYASMTLTGDMVDPVPVAGVWEVTIRCYIQNGAVGFGFTGIHEQSGVIGTFASPGGGAGVQVGRRLRITNYVPTTQWYTAEDNTPNSAGWWWVKVLQDGVNNEAKLKAWVDGSSEPTAWDLTVDTALRVSRLLSVPAQLIMFSTTASGAHVLDVERVVLEQLGR